MAAKRGRRRPGTARETDPATFYTPAAYARLRSVKAEVDPGELFRANDPIPAR